ncbi:MAG: hypothetical protein ACREBO_01555 [Novosphingobium sp.]
MADHPTSAANPWAWLGKLLVALVALYAVWWLLVKPAPFDLPAEGTEVPPAAEG